MNNAQKLLEKIQNEKISQTQSWVFTIQNIALWAIYSILILLGSISFSILLFSFLNTDIDILHHITHSSFEFFLAIAPILWVGLLFLFLFIAYFGLQYTKKGYKYTLFQIVGINIGISIILGNTMYFLGGAEKIDKTLGDMVSEYESMEKRKISHWSHPEEGILSGEILKIDQNTIKIRDFYQKIWIIDIQNTETKGNSKENILIQKNNKIKIFGNMLKNIPDNTIFIADEIRPWGGYKGKGRKSQ